jgi:phospholipase C
LAASASVYAQPTAPHPRSAATIDPNIHKIKHVIVIMQENRSFDSYFGTFPGADGIPPGVCLPDLRDHGCTEPWANHNDSNGNNPHAEDSFKVDVDGGKMDGFVTEAERQLCKPGGGPCRTDVMGYHVGTDIPNYWAYAKNFVLDDRMFESDHTWSLPSHLALTSGWSAVCQSQNPMSCTSSPSPRRPTSANPTPYAWTDLTWLLHKNNVSWGYYLDHGAQSSTNRSGVPQSWSALPGFSDVHQDNQTGNIQPLTSFMAQAKAGTLPQVSWIVPNVQDSEHPPALVSTGQAYVTRIINAVMSSSDWNSSAIFLAWDDWSGMYDNVAPPTADSLGYGIRVPGLVISPYARRGLIDSQTLSFDAYLKFIEDDFLNGARINPATDGRPDSRPDVRENLSLLGDLAKDFNFSQAPLPPLILDPCPANTTLTPKPKPGCNGRVKLPRHIGDS